MLSRFGNYAPSFLDENEHLQLSTDICNEIEKNHLEDSFFISFIPELRSDLADLTLITMRVFKSEYTKYVKESDTFRTGFYRAALRNLRDDCKFIKRNHTTGTAASIVLKVFDDHPVKYERSYTEKSVQLKNLFEALEEVDESIPKTSAATRITQLYNEQETFDKWRKKQIEDLNSKHQGTLISISDEVSFKTNAALSYLETQSKIHGGEYENSAQLIEEIIMKIMTPARARKTKRRSANSEVQEITPYII